MNKKSMSVLLLFLTMVTVGCESSIRKQWREQIKQPQEATFDQQDSMSMEQYLQEIDQSASVQAIQKELKRYDKSLTKALDALYSQTQARRALGLIYLNNHLYLAALNEFEKALAITPDNALLHYYAGISSGWYASYLADINLQQEYQQRALFHLKKAIEINPQHADSILALATLYTHQIPNLEEAKILLRRYRSLRPNSLQVIFLEATIATQEQNIRLARELYQQVIDGSAANPQLQREAQIALQKINNL